MGGQNETSPAAAEDAESPSIMGGQNETSPAAAEDAESPSIMGGQNDTSPAAAEDADDCHTKVPAWPTHLSAPNIAPLQLDTTGVVLQDYEDQAVFHDCNESESSKQEGQEKQPSLIEGAIASGAREGVISSGAHVATSTRGRGRPPSGVGRTSNKTGRGRGRPRGGGRARDASSSAVHSSNVNSNATGEEHTEGTATTAPTRGSTVAPTRGRGSSRGRGRGRSLGRRLPARPVALSVQQDWEVEPFDEITEHNFGSQHEVVDYLLADRCKKYVLNLQRNLTLKLSLHSMETNELNLFHLLISSAFDALIEYTNESLNEKQLLPLTYGEFRQFLGTLFLSSVFNTSVQQSWSIMNLCTGGKHMCRERFIQVLSNLRGYDMRRRIIQGQQDRWINQRNTLDHLHALEKKVFERSVEFFFDTLYSSVALDDELTGSKAQDVEVKIVTDRKAEGEGPTSDCICDSYLQLVLGMRIKTFADSQLTNVEKLLDCLPSIDENTQSMLGPIMVCDRGYGKKSVINLLSSRNFKVLTIASTIGSDHPIVGSTTVLSYLEKVQRYGVTNSINSTEVLQSDFGVLQSNVADFLDSVKPFTVSDNPNELLGPEIVVAQHCEKKSFYAYCIRDIYDKKVEQKLLRFFIYGFPNMDFLLGTWVSVPKTGSNGPIKPLFNPTIGRNDSNTTNIENCISRHAYALTRTQRTAEWFIFRGFHITATLAARILNSSTALDEDTKLTMLVASWFNRERSTTDMKIGTKNEDAILRALRCHQQVSDLWSCGLFESKEYPWLAASPDAIAIVKAPGGRTVVATVEVKTRVSPQRIAQAEEIARQYTDKPIVCVVGENNMSDVMDKDHATQVLIQMITLKVQWALYVVGQPGTASNTGRIIYIVFVYAPTEPLQQFMDEATAAFEPVLSRFYTNTTVDAVMESLPDTILEKQRNLIRSRWPFFTLCRNFVVPDMYFGFPSTSVIKTAVQTLYNSLKGGLDANTQQYASIVPPIKTGFEQKYIIRLLMAIVTNSWRAQQVLLQPVNLERQFSLLGYRKALVNNCPSLKDFNYKLAMALIDSASDPYFQNVLVADANRRVAAQSFLTVAATLERDPVTLQERIDAERWPKKHRYRGFTHRKNLVELRLTENDQFHHVMEKGNTKKTHCALCVKGKTMYKCSLCNVALCKTVKDKSHKTENCFTIWHTKLDLIIEHNKIKMAYGRCTTQQQKQKRRRRVKKRGSSQPTSEIGVDQERRYITRSAKAQLRNIDNDMAEEDSSEEEDDDDDEWDEDEEMEENEEASEASVDKSSMQEDEEPSSVHKNSVDNDDDKEASSSKDAEGESNNAAAEEDGDGDTTSTE
jgi:hypothetical protein